MADEENTEETPAAEGAATAKGGSKKMLFIVGGIVLLLVAIGVPVAILTLKGGDTGPTELAVDAAHAGEELKYEGGLEQDEIDEGLEPLGAIFPLDNFLINLNEGRFLRCQMQLEFEERDVPERFYSRLIPIRDGIIDLLTSKSAGEISGSTGREVLKGQIRDHINEYLRKNDVKQVYFTQFVIQ